jgi:hypothetical protein
MRDKYPKSANSSGNFVNNGNYTFAAYFVGCGRRRVVLKKCCSLRMYHRPKNKLVLYLSIEKFVCYEI